MGKGLINFAIKNQVKFGTGFCWPQKFAIKLKPGRAAAELHPGKFCYQKKGAYSTVCRFWSRYILQLETKNPQNALF